MDRKLHDEHGVVTPGFPCMGAWISYGLGSLTDNLPSFVVIPDPAACRTNNQGIFRRVLPVAHQGTIIRPTTNPDRDSISATVGQIHHQGERGDGWRSSTSSTATT